MKSLAYLILLGCFALCGSGAAFASGNCGMNSNEPCPPPEKLNSKEPAYKDMNSNKPAARRAHESTVATDVQSGESGETEAKATLSGVSASDLKMPKPPAGGCSMNSNTPCKDEGQPAAPAEVKTGEGAEPAKATLSGVSPSDLKIKPKPTKSQRKEPVE